MIKNFLYNEYVLQSALIAELKHKIYKYECISSVNVWGVGFNLKDFLDGKYTSRFNTYVTVYEDFMSIRFLPSTENGTTKAGHILVFKTKSGQPVRLKCLSNKSEKLKELCVTNLNHLRRGRWGSTDSDSKNTKETSGNTVEYQAT